MCDLFALSAKSYSSASRSLPVFGVRARKNVDGWGIGFFRRQRACVEKSGERVYTPGHLHESFQRLARVIKSPTIIAHIRFQTSGKRDECHAHPFVLHFMGRDWIFAHNGKAPIVEAYQSPNERLEATSDSARAFEFLRDQLAFYYRADLMAYSVFEAVRRATSRLLTEYPGGYNYLLSDGIDIFAFTNHRQFMLLKKSIQLEEALLLTTIAEGLSPEAWHTYRAEQENKGLLLLIAGGEVVMQQEVAA